METNEPHADMKSVCGRRQSQELMAKSGSAQKAKLNTDDTDLQT
jgi:hypothetical protein